MSDRGDRDNLTGYMPSINKTVNWTDNCQIGVTENRIKLWDKPLVCSRYVCEMAHMCGSQLNLTQSKHRHWDTVNNLGVRV